MMSIWSALDTSITKKKVITFIIKKGAGVTRHGEPYEAICVRHVTRPEIMSDYFLYSNVVNLHNQGRPFDLALE